jgi:protein SCO1/2
MNRSGYHLLNRPAIARPVRSAGLAALAMVALGALASPARAQMAQAGAPGQPPRPGTMLQKAGFDQRLGEKIPLDLPFRDEAGSPVKLDQYFGRKPVILTLVYYRCPMLCGQSLVSLTRSLRAMTKSVGDDFEIVTVSFDAQETPAMAAAKKRAFLEYYHRPRADRGWHFLTGDQPAIDALCQSVGFRYVYNASNGQFAHAAGLIVLAPDGLVTRYYLDIDYPPKQLLASIDGASARHVSNPVGQMLMLCYDYDPSTGKYTLAVVRILQVLGTATALLLGTYILAMLRRERSARSSPAGAPSRNADHPTVPPARPEPVAVASIAGDA